MGSFQKTGLPFQNIGKNDLNQYPKMKNIVDKLRDSGLEHRVNLTKTTTTKYDEKGFVLDQYSYESPTRIEMDSKEWKLFVEYINDYPAFCDHISDSKLFEIIGNLQ